MTDPTNRRRFRFSLRTLLIVVVLLSLPLGWFALKLRQAERQRQAVEAIREAGGYVSYDYEFSGQEPPSPARLTGLLGEDFFADVVYVNLDYPAKAGDVDLEQVETLTALSGLSLSRTQVTDEGLVHLKGLTKLESLGLWDTQITDAGLAHLKGLAGLETLSLINTRITNAGLENLKGLTKLEFLALCDTQITDAGLEHLQGLTKLEVLGLSNMHVTDAGLEHLKGLTQLKALILHGSHVTDEGVEQFWRALPNCDVQWGREDPNRLETID